ncbi:MAG: DUF362 domain-containing protein [bacterium]
MRSFVYFKEIKSNDLGALKNGLKQLLKDAPFFEKTRKKELIPIKLTFGEKGNKGYPNPSLVKVIVDKIKANGAKPFLTDSNVLYHGARTNAVDHINMAYEHGFLPNVCGAPIIIADGIFSENSKEIPVDGKALSSIKVPASILSIDSIIGLAHFTGHMLTGFGGAIKNIGMGLANRAGKQVQHSSVKPKIYPSKCVYCKKCVEVCPVNAIDEKNQKAEIDQAKCIGCADCIAACRFSAVEINWAVDVEKLEERMVEYAYGILKRIKNSFFINILTLITKECDCLETGTERIVEDIGIVASTDAVALDKASLDLVLERTKTDIFKEAHPNSDYKRQLTYGAQIGLGNLEYDLIKLQH